MHQERAYRYQSGDTGHANDAVGAEHVEWHFFYCMFRGFFSAILNTTPDQRVGRFPLRRRGCTRKEVIVTES